MTSFCSISGCGKPARTRGWCNAHYKRWRKRGDPLGGGTAKGAAQRFFREVVITHDGNDCLIWPYGRTGDGYGRIRRDGRRHLVHRLACEHRQGPPPTDKHEAAHSCGKGHEGCVNPLHLSWKTPAENCADKLAHGTQPRGERHAAAKLTEADVREIRALRGVVTGRELAERFGVAPPTIFSIHTSRSWRWL